MKKLNLFYTNQREFLIECLKENKWNVLKTSKFLGLTNSSLRNKIKRLDISYPTVKVKIIQTNQTLTIEQAARLLSTKVVYIEQSIKMNWKHKGFNFEVIEGTV